MTDENQEVDQDIELHDEVENENEIVEAQGHDPKNAPKQATDAAAKADDAAPQAAAPTSPGATAKNNNTKDPMPKTKAGMINAMFKAADKMKASEMKAVYAGVMKAMKHQDNGDENGKNGMKEDAEIEYQANFQDDLSALVESEATLSDEFKNKAETIFEAAIKSKLSEEIDRLEAKYEEELAEEIKSTKDGLVEKVDSYLNYVVENWMEENKLAVQSGLRTEIAEKFMNNLKDLFTESYIEVPESKVDLVDELAETVDELEEKLNDQTGRSIKMAEELETYKRNEVIREASKGLADTQVEKLEKLVANVDFDDAESFAEKVNTVKESYFNKKAVTGTTDLVEEEDAQVETSGSMEQYLSAIKRVTSK